MFKIDFSKKFFFWIPTLTLFFNLITFTIFIFYPGYYILRLAGTFNILVAFLSFLFFVVYHYIFYQKALEKILFLLVTIGFFIGIFMFSETLFESGHDQGGYLGYAARIAYSGSLNIVDDTTVSMFQYVYRDGKIDLAWPNVELWTFFLATFYYILNLSGFAICNLLLQVWGLSFITVIAHKFLSAKSSTILIFFTIYSFSYYTIHYTRSGYIENILFFQLWAIIYFFLSFLLSRQKIYYFASFLFSLSILFTRPEGIIYLVSFFLATGVYLYQRKILLSKHIFFLILFGVFLSFAIDLFLFKGFLSEGIKNISIYWSYNYRYAGQFSILGVILTYTLTAQIMSLCGWSFLSWRNRNPYLIFIFLFLLPQIMFLLFPNIQLVMPWAYRRFWPGLFVFGILLFYISYKKNIFIFKTHYFLLIFISLFTGAGIYGISWNENIFNQIKNINTFLDNIPNKNFGLISIDHSSSIYTSLLSDFFGKSLVIDNPPFKQKNVLNYYFNDKEDIYIFSILPSADKVISLYKKQLNLDIRPSDIILERSYNLSLSQVPPYFDANSLFGSKRDFLGYNKLMAEGQILSEKSILRKNIMINVFRLKNNNYFRYQKSDGDENLQDNILDGLSNFNVSELRV